MAARKRKPEESFKAYRSDLESQALFDKRMIEGRMIFVSAPLIGSRVASPGRTAIADRLPPRKKERKGRAISYSAA